jgi:hypothetical protein
MPPGAGEGTTRVSKGSSRAGAIVLKNVLHFIRWLLNIEVIITPISKVYHYFK